MFAEIKNNFGFGMMRLPMLNNDVDYQQVNKMVDLFIDNGFNYFDTAHMYIDGKSEIAVNKCLTSRYKRDQYVLTNKLSPNCFKNEEDIIPMFNEQLKICGVDYFDFYLMHAQNEKLFQKYREANAYETAFKLKQQGKIKHVGISFHDSAEVLENILNTYPEIEVVQIQFNYLDYQDDVKVQSRLCYQACVKHHIPCFIMEPVKGGALASIPGDNDNIFTDLNNGSVSSYALRFVSGFENNRCILSGMSSLEQMQDNISIMTNIKPLNQKELEAIDKAVEIFHNYQYVKCTECKYCMENCPTNMNIPELFKALNKKVVYKSWAGESEYKAAIADHSLASQCLECGLCEERCPQHIEIRKYLKEVVGLFEKH